MTLNELIERLEEIRDLTPTSGMKQVFIEICAEDESYVAVDEVEECENEVDIIG